MSAFVTGVFEDGSAYSRIGVDKGDDLGGGEIGPWERGLMAIGRCCLCCICRRRVFFVHLGSFLRRLGLGRCQKMLEMIVVVVICFVRG